VLRRAPAGAPAPAAASTTLTAATAGTGGGAGGGGGAAGEGLSLAVVADPAALAWHERATPALCVTGAPALPALVKVLSPFMTFHDQPLSSLSPPSRPHLAPIWPLSWPHL